MKATKQHYDTLSSLNSKYEKDRDKDDALMQKYLERVLEAADKKGLVWEIPTINDIYVNGETGNVYNTFNSLMLTMHREVSGFDNPIYLSMKAIKENNLKIEKDTIAGAITKNFTLDLKDKETGEIVLDEEGNPLKVNYSRKEAVYNISQLSITDKSPNPNYLNELREKYQPLPEQKYGDAELNEIYNQVKNAFGVKVVRKSNANFYVVEKDEINIAPESRQKSALLKLHTLMHEEMHATGHPSRLNRPSLLKYFEDDKYRAYEECAVNISAGRLLQDFNIKDKPDFDLLDRNHIAYDAGWLNAFDNKAQALLMIAKTSTKIYNYASNILVNHLKNENKLDLLVNHKINKDKKEEVKEEVDNEIEEPTQKRRNKMKI